MYIEFYTIIRNKKEVDYFKLWLLMLCRPNFQMHGKNRSKIRYKSPDNGKTIQYENIFQKLQ